MVPLNHFFARFTPELPLSDGSFLQQYQHGEQALDPRPVASEDHGLGYAIRAGLLLRLGPLWRRNYPDQRATIRFEDEDF